MLLKSIPALWLIHKQTKKIPHHDPIMQRIKNYCSVLGSYCLPSYLQSNVVLNLSSQLYEYLPCDDDDDDENDDDQYDKDYGDNDYDKDDDDHHHFI